MLQATLFPSPKTLNNFYRSIKALFQQKLPCDRPSNYFGSAITRFLHFFIIFASLIQILYNLYFLTFSLNKYYIYTKKSTHLIKIKTTLKHIPPNLTKILPLLE